MKVYYEIREKITGPNGELLDREGLKALKSIYKSDVFEVDCPSEDINDIPPEVLMNKAKEFEANNPLIKEYRIELMKFE